MNDGWYSKDQAMVELVDILNEIYDLHYEIDSCIKGCSSNCYNYEQLADYVDELGDKLKGVVADLRTSKDPDLDT